MPVNSGTGTHANLTSGKSTFLGYQGPLSIPSNHVRMIDMAHDQRTPCHHDRHCLLGRCATLLLIGAGPLLRCLFDPLQSNEHIQPRTSQATGVCAVSFWILHHGESGAESGRCLW